MQNSTKILEKDKAPRPCKKLNLYSFFSVQERIAFKSSLHPCTFIPSLSHSCAFDLLSNTDVFILFINSLMPSFLKSMLNTFLRDFAEL